MIIDKSQNKEMSLCFPIANIQSPKREVKYFGLFFLDKFHVSFGFLYELSYTTELNYFFLLSKTHCTHCTHIVNH